MKTRLSVAFLGVLILVAAALFLAPIGADQAGAGEGKSPPARGSERSGTELEPAVDAAALPDSRRDLLGPAGHGSGCAGS
jgi:hypothetical protein